ncbi:hypothetical protein [Isoptericola haloaureus]|uniref:HlyD family secretion protein n=1 Tax=Isoptericola haloaureus TaxID=1542902 RepID=A0ABU7Z9Y4_9MICO
MSEALTFSGDGIITWLPEPGDLVRPGEPLLEVNGRPVFFLSGDVPLWRELSLGDRGKDVLSLNEALHDAGHLSAARVDEVFGEGASGAVGSLHAAAGYVEPSGSEVGRERIATAEGVHADAVAALQEARDALAARQDTGGEQDAADAATSSAGAHREVSRAQEQVDTAARELARARAEWVAPSDVVILDVDELQVDEVVARVGDPAGGEVLRWTVPEVHVLTDVTPSQRTALAAGDEVEVVLPSAATIPGVIGRIGARRAPGGEESAMSAAADSTPVRVDLDDQDVAAELVGSPVRVEVVTDEVESALVVPVTALVALAEGGYAVEKLDGTRVALVPVDVQLVAEARAAISSGHLVEGDEVVVP